MKVTLSLLACLVAVPLACSADTAAIYLAIGPDGEASFSDFAMPDAVAVDLEVHQPSTQQVESVRERLEQTAEVAAQLETARLAREQERADRRAEAARRARSRVALQPVPEYRRVTRPGYFFPPYFPGHWRPPGPEKPWEPIQVPLYKPLPTAGYRADR